MMDNVLFDVVRDGYQCLTIPRSGRYRFEVIGASWLEEIPGAQIIGEVRLKKGEKITVALGQRGSDEWCGSGATFVVKDNGISGPQPLFVAAETSSETSCETCGFIAELSQTAFENFEIGSSGVQKFFANDEKDIYCCGAGFLEEPVTGPLRKDSVAPKSYKDGLIGGKGIFDGDLTEGGFGGGGAFYYKNGHVYYGGGGGYTGGGSKLYDDFCDGGGGGSFSIDREALFDHIYEEFGKCTITYLD